MPAMDKHVYIARWIQIISGIGSSITSIASATSIAPHYEFYFYQDWLFGPLCLAFSMITIVLGGIGMFATKRPGDVHWHLVLSLDYLQLAVSMVNIASSTIAALSTTNITVTVPWIFLTVTAMITITVPIFKMLSMKKRGLLPRPSVQREDWYRKDEAHSSKNGLDDFHLPSVRPTSPQKVVSRSMYVPSRQPSHTASKAETTARWSGTSGIVTTIESSSDNSETSSVPSYPVSSSHSMMEMT